MKKTFISFAFSAFLAPSAFASDVGPTLPSGSGLIAPIDLCELVGSPLCDPKPIPECKPGSLIWPQCLMVTVGGEIPWPQGNPFKEEDGGDPQDQSIETLSNPTTIDNTQALYVCVYKNWICIHPEVLALRDDTQIVEYDLSEIPSSNASMALWKTTTPVSPMPTFGYEKSTLFPLSSVTKEGGSYRQCVTMGGCTEPTIPKRFG